MYPNTVIRKLQSCWLINQWNEKQVLEVFTGFINQRRHKWVVTEGIKPSLEVQGVKSFLEKKKKKHQKNKTKQTNQNYYSIQVTRKDRARLCLSWPGPTTFIIFKGASWGLLGWNKEKTLNLWLPRKEELKASRISQFERMMGGVKSWSCEVLLYGRERQGISLKLK